MRVSGTSHGVNSRQNDKRTKKRKNGTPAAAEKHGLGGAGGQRPVAPHLARGRTVDRSDQGQQERGARPLLVAPDVPAWIARVGGLPDETRPGGHRKPRAACGPVEERVIDNTTPTRRRGPGRQRMAERTRTNETDDQGVLCQ